MTNGLIGSPTAESPTLAYTSSMYPWIGTPYSLTYHAITPSTQGNTFYTIPPVTLHEGWNVVTATVNGSLYSWVVEGRVFSLDAPFMTDATLGSVYNQSITAPTGFTLSYAVTSGTIPGGLTFSINGSALTVSGTPTTTGTVFFTLSATDPNGTTTTQTFWLTVPLKDVSSQVSGTVSAQTYNPSTQTYDGTITLTNTGTTTLTGTLEVVLTGLPGGAGNLANADGTFWGNPYVLVSLPSGGLAPGQSVTFTVHYRYPVKPFSFTTYEESL